MVAALETEKVKAAVAKAVTAEVALEGRGENEEWRKDVRSRSCDREGDHLNWGTKKLPSFFWTNFAFMKQRNRKHQELIFSLFPLWIKVVTIKVFFISFVDEGGYN